MPTLLDHLNDYLIAQNLVRDPRTNAPSKPPLWVEPEESIGVPAPGIAPGRPVEAGADIVVGAFKAPDIRLGRHNGFRIIEAVDFVIRTREPWMVDDFYYEGLRPLLHDKRGWTMEGLWLSESLVYRELAPLGRPDANGSVHTIQFTFERHRNP